MQSVPERIRIDEFGLIQQDGKGKIKRILLPEEEVATLEAADDGERRVLLADPDASSSLSGGLSRSARIDCLVDRGAACLSAPVRIYYNIETACDLNCRFCGPRQQTFLDSSLHVDAVRSEARERFILEEVARAGAFQVQLTGGEVFLRAERLFQTLRICKQLGLGVVLATNGLWSRIQGKRAFARRLANYGNIVEVKVSIDGEETFHDHMRKRTGSYRAAVDTAALLVDCGLPVRINATVFKQSCTTRSIDHLVELAQSLGTALQVVPERACGRSLGRAAAQLPSQQQLLAYTQRACELRESTGIALSFNFDILGDGRILPDYDPGRPFSCGAGLWGFAVTHAGEVFPCGFTIEAGDRRFLAGAVREEGDLLRIWKESPVLFDWRHAGKSSKCRACGHYKRTCWGGCMVQAYVTQGALNAPDPYCFAGLLGQ